MDKLIEALEKKRGDTPIALFAKRLGVHYSTYYRLLKGERGVGADLQRRILTHYPELALVFLSTISPIVEDKSTPGEPQPPPAAP